MLVFVSDLHLCDGTLGDTVTSGVFKEFADSVKRIVEKDDSNIKELQVVFLGDIFDLIRSQQWEKTKIRPWSDEKGKKGDTLKDWTGKIFDEISKNENNVAGFECLKALKADLSKKISVTYHYVIGNHDWLLNRYPDIRLKAAEILGIDGDFLANPFPEEVSFPEYHVFGRHGDKFDWMNFDGKTRDASSIGDAIVIDLLAKFPKEVERVTETKFRDQAFIKRLKDIDNVRPLYMLPLWLDTVCRKSSSPRAIDYARNTWNTLVEKFFEIPFVKDHDSWGPDRFDIFQEVFSLKPGRGLETALKAAEQFSPSDYQCYAKKEPGLWHGETRYVVYGHTHDFQISPLGTYEDGETDITELYFNSGTWRKLMQKAVAPDGTMDFVGWQVMTSVFFYKEDERKGRPFEVLNGILGLKT